MKYVSLDLETTSLEIHPNNILQISIVVEDTETAAGTPVEQLPHFTRFIEPLLVTGQPYALAMNAWILDYLSGRAENPPYPICKGQAWIPEALEFLQLHFGEKRPVVAGKNVAMFDLQFMPKPVKDRFSHRTIDPAMLYMDWKNDRKPPSLIQCMERAGIKNPEVTHDARQDALDVITCLRPFYLK